MKLTHAIGAMIGLFVLQYIQNYIANIRLGNVKDSFQRSDVYVCDHPTIDDRTEITLERINIKHSAIHNFGLFANASIPCGAVIYDAYTLQPVRMLKNTWFEFSLWRVTPPFARVNHQHVPSARITFHPQSTRWVVHALREIRSGEEVTIDYLDRPYFAPPPYPQWDIGTTTSNSSSSDHDIDFFERTARLCVIFSKWIVVPSALLFFL